MNTNISATNQVELMCLRELSARIGNDPLLTQASTGNRSIKLDGEWAIQARFWLEWGSFLEFGDRRNVPSN